MGMCMSASTLSRLSIIFLNLSSTKMPPLRPSAHVTYSSSISRPVAPISVIVLLMGVPSNSHRIAATPAGVREKPLLQWTMTPPPA